MEAGKEILVEVKGLSKKFSRSLKRSLWYGLQDIWQTLVGKNGKKGHLRKEEFWAVKDINFTLRRGECLGLIGHNGAGKSTLLKMLNGLIKPNEGSILMRGKIGALIELGAGFNPLLSGRENIYVKGQLLGFSRKEVDGKLNAILEFADIGDFIDSPVQNYSSGMKVRLGFAVAAQMNPDVLIIDEVLAVGDLGFVLKCFNVIDNILPDTAVIFVSHNMPQVSRICSRILLMDKGREIYQGDDVSKGIDLYYRKFGENKKGIDFARNEDAELVAIGFDLQKDTAGGLFGLNHGDDLRINLKLRINSRFNNPSASLIIFDKEQRPVGICVNEKGLLENNIVERSGAFNIYETRVQIPKINLSKGIFSISLTVSERFNYKPLLRIPAVAQFQVFSRHQYWQPIEFDGDWT